MLGDVKIAGHRIGYIEGAGDKIPDGCDCVLDEESVDLSGPIAQVLAEAIPGQGVRRKGGAIADASRIAGAWRAGDLSEHRPRVRLVNVPGGSITTKLIANGLRAAGADVTRAEATARDVASIGKQLDGGDCDLLMIVGGSGGGRPDFAQAGGTQPDKLEAAVARVYDLVS